MTDGDGFPSARTLPGWLNCFRICGMGDLQCKWLPFCGLAPALLIVRHVLWHLPNSLKEIS